MDHSLRGYLSRRSDEELKAALRYCLQHEDEIYEDCVSIILDILEERILQSDENAAEN